jgi:signal transduction histidine kinase
MQISIRIWLLIGLIILFIGTFIGAFAYSNDRSNRHLLLQSKLLDLQSHMSVLHSLTFEYHLWGYTRIDHQWHALHVSIVSDWKALSGSSLGRVSTSWSLIAEELDRMKQVFGKLVKEEHRPQQGVIKLADIYFRQVLVKINNAKSELDLLVLENARQMRESQRLFNRVMAGVIVILLAMLSLLKWNAHHLQLQLRDLMSWATAQINYGKLEVQAPQIRNEELGHFAQRIGLMVTRFNSTLVSRNELAEEVNQRKRVEAKMKKLLLEMQRSNEELTQFAYVASHDLQEPLRVISGYIQLIERRYTEQLDDKGKLFINMAVEATERMQQLIQDLLEYSRITTRAEPFQRVAMRPLVQEVITDLSLTIRETQAKIDVDELPELVVDRTQMRQLLQNLLTNAIKFSQPGVTPRVRVRSQQLSPKNSKEPAWRLSVEDNGIGIEPQYFERIFEIFQRLHTRDAYPGSGIGLALCRKIVQRHEGYIEIHSQLNKGTRFEVYLPRLQESEVERTKQ